MTIFGMANLAPVALDIPTQDKLDVSGPAHPPRILILYGSLRPQSFSHKLALEAERLLRHFGGVPTASADVANIKTTRPARMCCGTPSVSN